LGNVFHFVPGDIGLISGETPHIIIMALYYSIFSLRYFKKNPYISRESAHIITMALCYFIFSLSDLKKSLRKIRFVSYGISNIRLVSYMIFNIRNVKSDTITAPL